MHYIAMHIKVAIVNKELIINNTEKGVEIALLEDKKLVEIHNEKVENLVYEDQMNRLLEHSPSLTSLIE